MPIFILSAPFFLLNAKACDIMHLLMPINLITLIFEELKD